jgi:glucan phosphoethanolaminetransferase (alkaline phosphatase superfamily)
VTTPPEVPAPGLAKRPAYEPAKRLLRPTGYNPDMRRPLTTVTGAVLVFLRVLVGLLWIAEILLNWNLIATQSALDIEGLTSDESAGVGLWILVGVLTVVLVVDAVFAILILRGHNWPRVVVMFFAVVSISSAFVSWWLSELEITITTSFLSTALDTLILLALSSRSAAAYARRNERR